MADAEYIGPVAGSTPADDSDFHTSDNPYATGRPGDMLLSSDYPNAAPLGYYTPPASDPNNPWATGAGAFDDPYSKRLTAEVAASLPIKVAAVYDEDSGDFPSAPVPYTDPAVRQNLIDVGQDDQLIPLDQRR